MFERSRTICSRECRTQSPEVPTNSARWHLTRRLLSCCALCNAMPCLSGDVNATDDDGKSLIFYAAKFGQTDTTKQLIEAGCDVTQRDRDGNTPLHEAVVSGNLAVAQIMLDNGNVNIDIGGRDGQSPLLLASSCGQLSAVKMLYKHGADLNKPDTCGNTPLYSALHRGWTDVANFLLAHHCDVNRTTANGRSCLYAAAHCNKIRCQIVVKQLFKLGYDFKKDAAWMTSEGCPVSTDLNKHLHRKLLQRAGLQTSREKKSFRENIIERLRRMSISSHR